MALDELEAAICDPPVSRALLEAATDHPFRDTDDALLRAHGLQAHQPQLHLGQLRLYCLEQRVGGAPLPRAADSNRFKNQADGWAGRGRTCESEC